MTERLTTAGAITLKHSMPTQATKDSYDLYRPLDKGGVAQVVGDLLKDGGATSVQHINNLGKVFFNHATRIGATTPLADYINESDERQAIIGEFQHKVAQILDGGGDKSEINNKLAELTGHYNKKIETQNLTYLLGQGSTAARMAKTGARGNPSQLATGTSTPLMAANVKGEMLPIVIQHSFAQGMKPAELIALSYMGRGSTVSAQLSTALPGALFKKLAPTVFHEVVTVPDCGTRNGIVLPIEDAGNIVGRFTADDNKLITEALYKEHKMSGQHQIKVRSAMTCEAVEGVCQHCYGLAANSKMPEIGMNVGVIAAQSVSEKLTQAMLSTKHKTTVGERKGNAYEQAANILNNPTDNFKDEATMSSTNGVVQEIKKTALGAHYVVVDGKAHFVPIEQTLKVNVGDSVKAGQSLSTGVRNPRKYVALRGMGDGRQYVSNELRGIYSGGLDPRHFEVISKNLLKYVQVNDPGETSFLPGEKIDLKHIAPHLADTSRSVQVDNAVGAMLGRGALHLTPGTVLDKNHVDELKAQGVTHVDISSSKLRITPIVPGLQTNKLLDRNWISKLSFSRLRDSLKESTATNASSDIHGIDPITSYMMGSEFGEGENGKY